MSNQHLEARWRLASLHLTLVEGDCSVQKIAAFRRRPLLTATFNRLIEYKPECVVGVRERRKRLRIRCLERLENGFPQKELLCSLPRNAVGESRQMFADLRADQADFSRSRKLTDGFEGDGFAVALQKHRVGEIGQRDRILPLAMQ